MKHYEISYLASTALSEEQLQATQKVVEDAIQKEEGILVEARNPIKKNLSHPMKNAQGNVAQFINISFDAEPEKIVNLQKNLKEEKKILRFMIVEKRERKIDPRDARREAAGIKDDRPKKEKVKFEEIDKKLEEILDNS